MEMVERTLTRTSTLVEGIAQQASAAGLTDRTAYGLKLRLAEDLGSSAALVEAAAARDAKREASAAAMAAASASTSSAKEEAALAAVLEAEGLAKRTERRCGRMLWHHPFLSWCDPSSTWRACEVRPITGCMT